MSVAETLLPVLQWAVSAGFSDATRPDGGPVLLRLPRLRHACNGSTHILRIQVHCEAPTTNALLLHVTVGLNDASVGRRRHITTIVSAIP